MHSQHSVSFHQAIRMTISTFHQTLEFCSVGSETVLFCFQLFVGAVLKLSFLDGGV